MTRIVLTIFFALLPAIAIAEDPNVLTPGDPAFGQELQRIHERGLQYKQGKLNDFSATKEYLNKLEKTLKSPNCFAMATSGEVGFPNYCRHCSLATCLGCSAAIFAAVAVCGGPEDIPCIAAALGAMSSCVNCLIPK